MTGVSCGSTPRAWVPACAGKTEKGSEMTGVACGSTPRTWVPAFAGKTEEKVGDDGGFVRFHAPHLDSGSSPERRGRADPIFITLCGLHKVIVIPSAAEEPKPLRRHAPPVLPGPFGFAQGYMGALRGCYFIAKPAVLQSQFSFGNGLNQTVPGDLITGAQGDME